MCSSAQGGLGRAPQSEVFGLSDGRTFEIINCDVREAPTAGGSEWVIGGP